MKKEGGLKILPSLICAAILIAVAIAAEVFYGITKYLPLCLFALTCLFPAVVNVIVMVLRLRLPEGKATDVGAPLAESVTEENEEEALTGKGKRRRKKSRKVTKKRQPLRAFARWYNRNRVWIAAFLALVATVLVQIRFFTVLPRMTSLYTMNYPVVIGMILLFTAFIALDKWCFHAKTGDEFTDSLLKNLRSVLALLQLALVCMMIASALKLFGVYDAQAILKYVMIVLFYYQSAFLVFSFAVSMIKKQLLERPFLNVPAPLAIGSSKELSLLSYFEENTGMTMRSLWSIRMIKNLIPYTIALAAALLWFCTGIVQIEPYQTGVVYRFGKMVEDPLKPGIHLTLPWPCDKVEIYNTENVQRFTVGYVSDGDQDNTWTGKHGSEEYRLLLGSRDELVSVNLRVEYKISDLPAYLKNNATPESLVKAHAYELVMDHTISNDLTTLLTVDREEFAEHFKQDLIKKIAPYNTGLEIVSVVLESIHPPIDISNVYQAIISAGIEAQRLVAEAQGYYEAQILKAETERNTQIYTATVNQLSKVAAAQAEVAEFMASVTADGMYPSTYRYYKYLNAVTAAYGNTQLVIVGDGIDSSNIYFGSLIVNGTASSGTTTDSEIYE